MSLSDLSIDQKLSLVPTHHFREYRLRPGLLLPYGATVVPGGINFSVFSLEATTCTLVLFEIGQPQPIVEIPFPDEFRAGDVFAMLVLDLDHNTIEYGFRMDGPADTQHHNRFDPEQILLDPYAKAIGGREVWGQQPDPQNIYQHRGRIYVDDFDWGADRPLDTPIEDLIIYEMHVRGFTQHLSSGIQHPGTYDGVREKIPYLKELGINCVELMPVFEFDEFENSRVSTENGTLLFNYWGYSPVGFFAPKAGYAVDGARATKELKALIKTLHENGIEVILDVVYNHTAEGNENGPTISFRGIDNNMYYLLTPDGYYYNFSGTGNTFRTNHPVVQDFVLDSLRYWAMEYHVDGFRFDLASVLVRDETGMPSADPPLLKAIAHDPILGKVKLIAEPWDADGLYHVGSFPAYGRWAEWNGKYRDALRKFLKGDEGLVNEMRLRVVGSPDLYPNRGPIATVNFITAHDGFTLADLVSYNEKCNEPNCEDSRDGANDNHSWNSGHEGQTDDPEINALRRRRMKSAIAILSVSQGIPMFLMGDEVGRTQGGNNNTYCQDNGISWLDWSLLETNAELFDFFKHCMSFRRAHPVLRNGHFLRGEDYNNTGLLDIEWYDAQDSVTPPEADKHCFAFMLNGDYAKGGLAQDNHLFVAVNMDWRDHVFSVPALPDGLRWHVFANTGAQDGATIYAVGAEPPLTDTAQLPMLPRSVAILVGR